MWRKTPLPSISDDLRLIGALLALTTLLPLFCLKDIADPLEGSWIATWGRVGGSGIAPLCLGWVIGFGLLPFLRRLRRLQRTLSFCAGVLVGLVPFLFYALTMSWWVNPAPLISLAIFGASAGVVLGALAWWYVPLSVWIPIHDQNF